MEDKIELSVPNKFSKNIDIEYDLMDIPKRPLPFVFDVLLISFYYMDSRLFFFKDQDVGTGQTGESCTTGCLTKYNQSNPTDDRCLEQYKK